MSTYIVLLRGVNVGGKNILPMKDLKGVLEAAGYRNVKTYIQSGNIVLDSTGNPDKVIGSLINAGFGFTPEVVALSKTAFVSAVSKNPYKGYEGKFVHFFFCRKKPKLDTDKLESYASATERYELHGKVFYIHAPDGIARSKLVAGIESCLGVPATGRNLNTVNRLTGMLE